MSNIVYSTEINNEIRKAYGKYLASLNKSEKNRVFINACYCAFADACEKDNKSPLKVYEDLSNEA
jgi:hypothetical protein